MGEFHKELDPKTIFERIKDVQHSNKSIVVLPDFFIDRIIKINNIEEFFVHLKEKTQYGGGSIRGIPTRQIEGGNAVNIAYILGKLGFNVNLFTISDDASQIVLKYFFQKLPNVRLNLSHGKPGFTTSMEIHNQINSSDSNIMISDVGDNSNYGPERLFSSDHDEILNNSDIVVLVNWASNLRGTDLLKYVFKNSPRALHFVDPADIQSRSKEFCNLLKDQNNLVHILSINENECNSLLVELNLQNLILNKKYNQENIKLAIKELAKNLKVFIDLHTRYGSACSNGKEVFFADTIKNITVNNLTGAGDSWDSADIIGHIINLAPQQRLFFSNIFASLYISMNDRRSISLEKFFEYYVKFLTEKSKVKKSKSINY
jgi:ribokinase